ncbi:MAG: 4-vinyl reductase [Candidatus Aenigmatarchaeota archaeon]
MFEENIFLKWVKEGKIEFTKEGTILAFNEHIIQIPVRVLNRLFILLKENLGENKAQEILKELGGFQVKQAFQRYIRIMGWKYVPKDKIWEFVKNVLISLGLGKYTIEKTEEKYIFLISKSPFAEEFVVEYGNQKNPIDHYIAGGLEVFIKAITGKPMVCEEIKCYAKGDDCCEFIVKPKEEKNSDKFLYLI